MMELTGQKLSDAENRKASREVYSLLLCIIESSLSEEHQEEPVPIELLPNFCYVGEDL